MVAVALGRVIGFLLVVVLIWLLAGTLNYAFTRRRYSFRQAIARPWVIGVGVVGLLLALMGQIASLV